MYMYIYIYNISIYIGIACISCVKPWSYPTSWGFTFKNDGFFCVNCASISPSSMRKPRSFTWNVCRPPRNVDWCFIPPIKFAMVYTLLKMGKLGMVYYCFTNIIYILLAMAMNTSPLLVNIPNFLWFFPFMLHKNDHRVRQNHQSASPPNSGLKVFAAKQINHTTLSPTSQIACPEKDQELKLWEATGCFLGICLQICIQFYVYNHNIHYYIHLSYVIDKIWWNLMKSINMYIYI